jgi:hypothetical protein
MMPNFDPSSVEKLYRSIVNSGNLVPESGRIGSTILVETKAFVRLIAKIPCSKCRQYPFFENVNVKKSGFGLKVTYLCANNGCKAIENVHNCEIQECFRSTLNTAAVAASINCGMTFSQFHTFFDMLGITSQLSKSQYVRISTNAGINERIQLAAERNIAEALQDAISAAKVAKHNLHCSFDAQWTHCREAGEASGELLCHDIHTPK